VCYGMILAAAFAPRRTHVPKRVWPPRTNVGQGHVVVLEEGGEKVWSACRGNRRSHNATAIDIDPQSRRFSRRQTDYALQAIVECCAAKEQSPSLHPPHSEHSHRDGQSPPDHHLSREPASRGIYCQYRRFGLFSANDTKWVEFRQFSRLGCWSDAERSRLSGGAGGVLEPRFSTTRRHLYESNELSLERMICTTKSKFKFRTYPSFPHIRPKIPFICSPNCVIWTLFCAFHSNL